MIRAAVALLVSLTLISCFPHNPRARTFAKIGEGTALLAGIAVAAFSGTGADCDEMVQPGTDTSSCKNKATILSAIGVTLIVAGLLGFVATVSTAQDDKAVEVKPAPAKPEPTPVATPPAAEGSAAGSAAGSGETTPPPAEGSAAGSATPPAP
jgi:hypothetical protein